jgi:undecaprenyl diphosphate synthase
LEAEALTASNTGLNLVVAFNYGGRQELVRVMQSLARDVGSGSIRAEDIDADLVTARLDTGGIPDPDLVIRTSGEMRLSNFLLWQAAYAEFVFTPVLWPDFDRAALEAAIAEFRQRERRFGGLDAKSATS